MIVRLVKLSFELNNINAFKSIFNESQHKIEGFEGCQRVELLQQTNEPNVFFTHSWWNTEQDLENYRNSDLFKATWAKTKVLFNAKPQAWSLTKQA